MLSPVLSIYIADLLHQVNEWPDSCLLMFIDDGNILSSGPSYRVVMAMLSNWYRECLLWLQRLVSQSRARGLKLSSTVCTNLGLTQMAWTPPMRYLTLLCDTHLLPHPHTLMSQNLDHPCHIPAVTLQTLISTTIQSFPSLSQSRSLSQASLSLSSQFCSSNSSFPLPLIFVSLVPTFSFKLLPPSPYSPGSSHPSFSSLMNLGNRAKDGPSCSTILPLISPHSSTPTTTVGGQLLC